MEDRTTRSAGRLTALVPGAGWPEPPDGPLAVLLRARRESAGLTQRELASQAGISLGALQDLEQGRTGRPRRQSLGRLAVVLRLATDQHEELVRVSAAAKHGAAGHEAAGHEAAGHGDGQQTPGRQGAEPGRAGAESCPVAASNGRGAIGTGPAGAGDRRGATGTGHRGYGNSGLRVEILGPLAVWHDGQPVPPGPVRQRAVLGLLMLHAGTGLHPGGDHRRPVG
jgi:transcriptional regulator with XRE-family HTH domain